jgi:parallel beta-helix repeat protein
VFISGTGSGIKNSSIHDVWNAGVYMHGLQTVVEGNSVWRTAESNYCGGGSTRGCNGDWNVGIIVGDSSTSTAPGIAANSVIRGNTVFHNSGEGIDCEHNDNVTIENNIVYDNWALGIYLDQCSFVTIRNNLVYYTNDTNWWRSSSHPSNAISISNENITNYPMGHDRLVYNNIMIGGYSNLNFYLHPNMPNAYLSNDLFANNTLINSQGAASVSIANAPHQNTRFYNNLVYQLTGTVASIGNSNGGITFASNLWSQSPQALARSSTDIITQNPGLVDPNHLVSAGNVLASWYKLTNVSPAINAGTYLSQVASDYAGTTRTNPPDIGAYQH